MSKDEEAVLRRLEAVIHSDGRKFLLWGGGSLSITVDPDVNKIYRFELTMTISSFRESTIQ